MKSIVTRSAASAFAIAAAVAAATPAHAQQTEVQALRAQIEALQSRLDKIEADQLKTSDAVKAAAPSVSSKFPLVVSGLLQVQGLGTVGNDAPSPGRADSFRLRRGELRITAPKITDRISGTLMIDPAKSQDGTPGNNVLQEIQLSYLLNKSAKGSTFVDVGQFKIPIGYESDQVSSSALQTVERALMFQALANDPLGGGRGDLRDTGVQLRGSMGQFDYRLGAFNGLGDRQSRLSLSDNKAIVARLAYRPTFLDGLIFGVSGARSNPRNATFAALPAGSPNQTINADADNAFIAYKKDKLTLQSEYTKLKFNAVQNGTTLNRKGYYGSAGYLFAPKIEGVLRYDKFDANTVTPNTNTREMTLGVNYYIKGNNAKIQANIVKVDPPTGAGGSSASRTELRTNFQVAF